MKIIKEGEYPSNNKIICNGCNCVFQYYDSEIQTRAPTLDEIEFFGGLHILISMLNALVTEKVVL